MTVNYLKTLYLDKPRGDSLPIFSAHSFASNRQIALEEGGNSTKECVGREGRSRGHLHTKRTRYQQSYPACPICARVTGLAVKWLF